MVRYTALLTGIFYGFSHRRTLQKQHDEDKRTHAIHEREHLISQAKEAWRKKQEGPKSGGESIRILPYFQRSILNIRLLVITDLEDPRFDLEKLLAKWESEAQ